MNDFMNPYTNCSTTHLRLYGEARTSRLNAAKFLSSCNDNKIFDLNCQVPTVERNFITKTEPLSPMDATYFHKKTPSRVI
ncbi:hypothetical protein L914_02080, partial [Phytophthora nicotianae]